MESRIKITYPNRKIQLNDIAQRKSSSIPMQRITNPMDADSRLDDLGWVPVQLHEISETPFNLGDWVYSARGFVGKFGEFENSYVNECKKIIRTTDVSLELPVFDEKSLKKILKMIHQKKFTLPKDWHVVVTDENRETLMKWRFEKSFVRQLNCGDIVGISGGFKEWNRKESSKWGQEISYEDFKKYVLSNNNNSIYKVMEFKKKNIVILRGEFIAAEFVIYHDINKKKLKDETAKWLDSTGKLSAKSLAKYLTESGHIAMTKKQYKKLLAK